MEPPSKTGPSPPPPPARPEEVDAKKGYMDEFAEETSFHGIRYWLSQSGDAKALRALYFLLWVSMVVVTGVFLYQNLNTYLDYGTKV